MSGPKAWRTHWTKYAGTNTTSREMRYVSPGERGDMRVCATTRPEYSGGSPWTHDLKSLEARVEAKVEGLERKMAQGFKELTQLLTSQRADNMLAPRSSSPRGPERGVTTADLPVTLRGTVPS